MIYAYKVKINIESGRRGVCRYVIQDGVNTVTLYASVWDYARDLLEKTKYKVYMPGEPMPTPVIRAKIRDNCTEIFIGCYSMYQASLLDGISLKPMVVPFTDEDVNIITKLQSKLTGGDRSFAVSVLYAMGYLPHHVATRTNYFAYDRVEIAPYKGRFGSGYTIDYYGPIKGCHNREYWIKGGAGNETH